MSNLRGAALSDFLQLSLVLGRRVLQLPLQRRGTQLLLLALPLVFARPDTHTHTYTHTHIHTQTDTHTDKHTDTQTHRHTHRHTDTHTDTYTLSTHIQERSPSFALHVTSPSAQTSIYRGTRKYIQEISPSALSTRMLTLPTALLPPLRLPLLLFWRRRC